MAFGDPAAAYDHLLDAWAKREALTLDATEVADLVDQLPDEDEYIAYDEVRARLAKLPCNALKISRKARSEIAAAFGYDIDDVWP